jgi:hypothetical protein
VPLVPQRFNDVLFAVRDPPLQQIPPLRGTGVDVPPSPELSLDELQSHFHHYTSPTLAHLLALFVQKPYSFPPPNTCLIVIDSLSTLFDNAYPRSSDDRTSRNKNDQTRWAAGRKFAVMNELISKLTNVAAMHDVALLITSQPITRIRGSSRAVLIPAISGVEWENGISTRLVLFRDWVPGQGKWSDADADRLRKVRFIGVIKADGVTIAEEGGVGNVVPFAIESVSQFATRRAYNIRDAVSCLVRRSPADKVQTGLCGLNMVAVDIAVPTVSSPQARPYKRRFTEMDEDEHENPNSDELYGWVEDDEVSAEGLLIEEAAILNDANAADSRVDLQTEHIPCEKNKKVTRNSTV